MFLDRASRMWVTKYGCVAQDASTRHFSPDSSGLPNKQFIAMEKDLGKDLGKDLIWGTCDLILQQFTAFSNPLALRNDGQVEQASAHDVSLVEKQSDGDSDAKSDDTSHAQRISYSGYGKLK